MDGGAPQLVADSGIGGPTCAGTAGTGIANLEAESGWQDLTLQIPVTSTLQVRFVGETDDGNNNNGEGFLIDDVNVKCECPTTMDIDPDVLPEATINVAYSQQLVATGGAPPYTWDTLPGNPPPPGLALDQASGLLSGTPPRPGSRPSRWWRQTPISARSASSIT